MANLTANTPRKFQGRAPFKYSYPAGANLEFFVGQALIASASTGAAVNATPTASGKFLGFASEYKDNLTGSVYGGTAGSTEVEIDWGPVWLTVANGSNWARTDVGVTIYASDGNTFTTAAGTNNIVIGKVIKVPEAAIGAASGEILVAAEPTAMRSI